MEKAGTGVSEGEWLRVRAYLRDHRYELAARAAGGYPASAKVAGTPLLAAPRWLPASPLPLDRIRLEFRPDAGAPAITGTGDDVLPLLPGRPGGRRYRRYSGAISDLAAPAVFEDRPAYRLLEAGLAGPQAYLAFGRGRYFDGVDVGEAAAHEYAATCLGAPPAGLRAGVGDPRDLGRRPVSMAISTLTLRHDRSSGRAWFPLHWRDPAKVGHAGGLYQVVPVGVFQPSGAAPWNERNDFSLWRSMVREFAEELGGHSEDHGSEQAPIDYDAWPFARQMTGALAAGQIRAYCLGLGIDPLTFAADLLTVTVIDAGVFDELFGSLGHHNAEGTILSGLPFGGRTIEEFAGRQPVQAAAAALLRLAWAHRAALTG